MTYAAADPIPLPSDERGCVVARAVHDAVLYADIFDYPLTAGDIHRFLPMEASPLEVDAAIDRLLEQRVLGLDGGLLYLTGRQAIAAIRRARARHARRAWRRARGYARIIRSLPFVRMVAVTGALAMDNVDAGDDIDFLIVAEPGHVWTARGLVLLVCRVARVFGDTLCPNYLLSTRALAVGEPDLYAAHELAQIVPLYGRDVIERLRAENAWSRDILPNATYRELSCSVDRVLWLVRIARWAGERLLSLPPGIALERWEQRRKIAKLSRGVPAHVHETLYTADVCKGHVSGHGSRVMEAWSARTGATSDEYLDGWDGESVGPVLRKSFIPPS